MRHAATILFLFLFSFQSYSQQTEEAVVVITATINSSLPSVDLAWPVTANTSEQLLLRREKDSEDWFLYLDETGTTPTSEITDEFVEIGETYEYVLVQINNGITAFGYMTVAIEAPVVDSRGSILVFVEEALQMPLGMELQRLENDLIGDGWKVVWHPVAEDATVEAVKAQIVADYNADPSNINSVLLLGEIPVPYSGNAAWDGHTDHQGAWAADTYYGDIDGIWLDETVNNTTPSRAANDNIPGDGKFDHSTVPSDLEVAVGRVDFSNLSEATFGTTRTELMRRYLNKNHNWRTKKYTVQNQALVDDNFGYFGGEAFAANGYRNFYPLVGFDNVVDGDFFTDTDDQSFLFGYGCGGGSYTSANGVGNSGNFASDSVNIAFSMIFGSYHGDWDSENNPFMMSALASKGGILSCSWAGRPHWFNHHLAAGETLGYCGLATQNACNNDGYFGSLGNCGAHVALLGDPTLRTHIVAPVSELAMVNKCAEVELTWTASPAAELLGYHVYKSDALNGDFTRLTNDPIMATTFTDGSPILGENFYQIKAVVLEETPSALYFNTSTGVIGNTVFEVGTPPSISTTDGLITCINSEATISANSDADMPTYSWSSPTGFGMEGQTIMVTVPGAYTVTVTDGLTGCSATAIAIVNQDSNIPIANPAPNGAFNCINSEVTLLANPGEPNLSFEWTGPNSFLSIFEEPIVILPGTYTLIISSMNGCTNSYSITVEENFVAPNPVIASPAVLNCGEPVTVLDATASSPADLNFGWSTMDGSIVSGNTSATPTVDECGTYMLTITDPINGCSATALVAVECDFTEPVLTIDGDPHTLCFGDMTTLEAISDIPNSTFEWLGSFDPFNPIQQLFPDLYQVTTTAPNGCTASSDVMVTSNPEIIISFFSTIDCEGVLDLTVTTNGGEPPYTITTVPSGLFLLIPNSK